MLKLSSLALGLLTIISLAPSAQAFPVQGNTPDLHRRDENLRSQVILNVRPEIRREEEHRYRGESERHRQLELVREREVQARLAAERHRQLELAREREVQARLAAERRRQEYAQRRHNSHGEHRDVRGDYRRDYR
jgi:hypothetical protein